jgi:hypothetical protein
VDVFRIIEERLEHSMGILGFDRHDEPPFRCGCKELTEDYGVWQTFCQ